MGSILSSTKYLLLFYIIVPSVIGESSVSNDNNTTNQQCHYCNNIQEEKFQILTNQLNGMASVLNEMAKEEKDANRNQKTQFQEMTDRIAQLENLAAEQKDAIHSLTIQLQGVRDQNVIPQEGITTQVTPLVTSYKDCASYRNNGVNTSGIYSITPIGGIPFDAYCDMESAGGGWLVFQRRQDGSENFFRNWTDYQRGFGSLNNEFWLGNGKIAALTDQGTYELRVDLEDFDGNKKYAVYSTFSIDGFDKFRLSLGSYSGDAGDSLSNLNGSRWSTYDEDNDEMSFGNGNCASTFKGAWWYKNCHKSNLNGLYIRRGSAHSKGIIWYHFTGWNNSLKFSEMKLRPAGYTPPV